MTMVMYVCIICIIVVFWLVDIILSGIVNRYSYRVAYKCTVMRNSNLEL